MFDETAPVAQMQRVDGRAGAVIGAGGRLKRLWQKGAGKVMLPRMHGRPPEVVFLNTAGGLTGGDRLDYTLEVEAAASAVGTTQTAERAYRSTGATARVETRLTVGPGSRLHWLPQEVIVFEGAALERRLTVEMAGDAELVLLETLVLGRTAMGERLERIALGDRREVIRAGRLTMLEAIRLGPEDLARAGAAGLAGAVAVATLAAFAPDAVDRLARVRAVLPAEGPVRAAASGWDGRVVVRFLSGEAWPLRVAVARATAALTGAPLPRVWQV